MKSQSRFKTGSPLRESFPKNVLREADQFGSHIKQQDTAGRKDCRYDPVISIDPSSALDLDDAFSLQRTGGKRWKLRIHVADVSHYVKANSPLDREARIRGNSTYLVDRVIPMLPSSLSNGLCSLHPDSDRLTKCVELTLTSNGKVLGTRFFSGLIRSKKRFSYREAMGIIRGTQQGHLETMLRQSDRLAQKIRARRVQLGSLEFPSRETRLLLNQQGRVKAIEPVVHDRAHQLIEEFMLLANEAVATHLSKLQRVTIHRTHEQPDPARLRKFRGSLRRHQIPCGNLKSRGEIQRVMASLDRTPAGPALQIGLLRTLPRARYTTKPKGHFGLAKEHYAHFTSPIRRYADLLVHRSLFESRATTPSELHRIAEYLSATEKNSSEAEKESKRSKLCDYLIHKLRRGDTTLHTALVTQICSFGILVEVSELGVHGLIPRRLLKRNQYHLDLRQQEVRDRNSGRLITLGSPVQVTVSTVDTKKQRIDFTLSSPLRKPRKSSGKRP
jgi:ribonuclease R